MPPFRVVEISPEYHDLAEDSVKLATALALGSLVRAAVFNQPVSASLNFETLVASLVGLLGFHYIVDRYLVRFVVKSGTEGYYHVQKRYR